MATTKILSGATTTVTGSAQSLPTIDDGLGSIAVQGVLTGTGAVSATVVIEVSLDQTNYVTAGTITLSGTTSATDGFLMNTGWQWVRARVTAISGTSATLNVHVGH